MLKKTEPTGQLSFFYSLADQIDTKHPLFRLSKSINWSVFEDDIKSALKVELILLLDEFGYPPVERDEVYVEIFEQAENFKKNR